MGYQNLTVESKCYRCGKTAPIFNQAVQIVRYGYSGSPISLCEDCFRTFKTWLDGERNSLNEARG